MITPQKEYPKLAAALGFDGKNGTTIYFKREDLHPYGSHKGRSIPVMIDHHYAKGARNFALSSSGNAALAAALYVSEINKPDISLNIFIGNNIAPHKLERLQKASEKSSQIKLVKKERPLQALTQAVQEGATSLRQSTDDIALTGYQPLAEEVSQIPNIAAVFIGTSSGTTAQALAQYFVDKIKPVQIHIVQTSACHPITDAFVPSDSEEELSLADAIVDKTAIRKDALSKLIKKTGGTGWCATNENIDAAMTLVKDHAGLDISPNSALSVVGAMKAAYTGYEITGAIVCMICGE